MNVFTYDELNIGMTKHEYSTITFHKEAGLSIATGLSDYDRDNPGYVNIYSGYYDEEEGDGSPEAIYSQEDFDITIAHEFGHILGIKDGYQDEETKYIDSIMCDEFGERNDIEYELRNATSLDIEKALDAYFSDDWQYWK